MKIKLLAAAVALAALSSSGAYAATSGDNTVSGISDVVFQALDIATGNTVSWDLSRTGANADLTTADFYSLAGGLSFSLSDTTVSGFLANVAPGNLKWRVMGVAQDNVAPTNFGATLTSISVPAPGTRPASQLNTTAQLNSFLNALGNVGLDNSAKLINAGTAAVSWVNVAETYIFASTPADKNSNPPNSLGDLSFYYVHRDPTKSLSAASGIRVDKLGSFNLSNSGVLSYNVAAIPVPAAAWLFGSALAGIAGITRRKRQA